MDEMRKMQLMLVDILKEFDSFCKDKALCYYAIAGTALGSARHQGFIPWDDDIDVAMPREDYERLIRIYNKERTNSRYILESPLSDDNLYPYSFSKIYDTQTTLIEKVSHPIKRGIYIDIFPLDGAGNNKEEYIKRFNRIHFLFVIRKFFICSPNSIRSPIKNAILKFARLVTAHIHLEKILRDNICKKCMEKSYNDCIYIANYCGAWGTKEIMPKEFFGVPKTMKFENIYIKCPEKIIDYLEYLYGDWKQLPPKEKQISHHTYFLDLDTPYK